MKPVVIIGGGLAGLMCARDLHSKGIPILVLDAADRMGGRLKTDSFEGFKLDQGFQVLCEGYPHASGQLNLLALDLQRFRSGAIAFDGKELHTIDPSKPLKMAFSKYLGFKDKRKLASWSGEVASHSFVQIRGMHDMTAAEYFAEEGFSEDALAKFLRPFFAGVFIDPELQVSARQLCFVAKAMVEGATSLPANGMEEIPRQIAHDIPSYLLREYSRVTEILKDGHGHAVGVRLDTNEIFAASAVVVATDGETAAKLTGIPTVTGHSTSVTLYFETATRVVDEAFIVLNSSGKGLVHEVIPVTNVAPSYAPAGKHLVAATVLGNRSETDAELAEIAKKEMEAWFPHKGAYMFRFLRAYRIPYHQFIQPPFFNRHLPANATGTPGLFFAGEFTTNSSIDGAIESGLRCAHLVATGLEDMAA